MTMKIDYDAAARQLERASETRAMIQPLSRSAGMTTIDEAYAVQSAWSALREAGGERVLGRKIGLTSKAMQEQAGFDRPDFGRLWASRFFEATDGRVELPSGLFLQPRIEGEIAFLLKSPLTGTVSVEDVLAATEAVARRSRSSIAASSGAAFRSSTRSPTTPRSARSRSGRGGTSYWRATCAMSR